MAREKDSTLARVGLPRRALLSMAFRFQYCDRAGTTTRGSGWSRRPRCRCAAEIREGMETISVHLPRPRRRLGRLRCEWRHACTNGRTYRGMRSAYSDQEREQLAEDGLRALRRATEKALHRQVVTLEDLEEATRRL